MADEELPFDDVLNPTTKTSKGSHSLFSEPAAFDEEEFFGESTNEELDEIQTNFTPSSPEEYTKKKRLAILFFTSLPFILQPLSSTLATPSLPYIQDGLEVDYYATVGLTIGVYNLTAGIFPVFYGPVSDRLGRKLLWYVTLPLYIITAFMSGIAQGIWVLIFWKALMGAAACASVVVGAGIVSDIFPPENQGKALGVQQLPVLLAPIIGYPLGGVLTLYLTWRSVNFFLAIIAIPIALVIFFLVPETLPQKSRKLNSDGDFSQTRLEKALELLKAMNPWLTIKLLLHPIIGLIVLARSVPYAWMMFLVVFAPKILSEAYEMSSFAIGLWNLPFAIIGTVLGTIIGGVAVDRGLRKFGRGGRLISANLSSILLAIGLVGFGWTIEWNYWVGMIFSVMVGFGMTANRPGYLTYIMRELPDKTSAVTGVSMMCCLGLSLPLMIAGPAVAKMIGVAALFTIGGCTVLLSIIPALIIMTLNVERQSELTETEEES